MMIKEKLMRVAKSLWHPMDPWLFYAMLALYIMSLFLL